MKNGTEFIKNFVKKNAPYGAYENDSLLWEQTRAMFTTWCIRENHEADTLQTDEMLSALYRLSETKTNKDVFENFMMEFIV